MKSKTALQFFFWLQINSQRTQSFSSLKSFVRSTAHRRNNVGYLLQQPSALLSIRTSREEDETEIKHDVDQLQNDLEMFFASSPSLKQKVEVNGNNETEIKSESIEENESDLHTMNLPYAQEISDYISRPQSELIDTGLVLLSSFLVAVGTLPYGTVPESISPVAFGVEEALSYFFCFGFFLRWYGVGKLSVKYFSRPLPFIDFFASVLPLLLTTCVTVFGIINIPSWLMSNSALVNLRLLRILRLQELLVDIETFEKIAETLGISGNVRPYQLKLARVLISIFTLCSVATGLIYTAEHEVNPLIPDYFTALYFGLTTLTTVGFGDITPITLPGRLVVMGSILAGAAVVPAQAAELVEALLDFQTERRQKNMTKNTLRTRLESEYENDSMVDPRISCASCGRRSHRSDAFYCWSCGAKLWQ